MKETMQMSGGHQESLRATAGLAEQYFQKIAGLLERIQSEEAASVDTVAVLLADHIAKDRLIYVFGPGGHSNLASQEVFFRAGGLMHISAILDEGTLLSNGALRSMAIERMPGYGRVVIDDAGLATGDILILVNAYGINSALIDGALAAREKHVTTIGISSRAHAEQTSEDHPARHPSKLNLHNVVDYHIDSKVPIGDAVMEIQDVTEKTAAVSTFANAFTLNWLMTATIAKLSAKGIDPPLWRSGNAPGGDEANAKFIGRFKERVRKL